jgi:hypothetical protein
MKLATRGLRADGHGTRRRADLDDPADPLGIVARVNEVGMYLVRGALDARADRDIDHRWPPAADVGAVALLLGATTLMRCCNASGDG